jgi:hypothetical protein
MEPKWTPGPWQADGEPWNRVVWSSAENRVCFMAHSSGLNDDTDIATSNLIAAAPDLYAALEMAQLWLDVDGRFDMQGINAALAKARGDA